MQKTTPEMILKNAAGLHPLEVFAKRVARARAECTGEPAAQRAISYIVKYIADEYDHEEDAVLAKEAAMIVAANEKSANAEALRLAVLRPGGVSLST